jgi:two-component system sensor histidine kinase PhoQ
MPPERVAELLQRGRRGDQSQPGHGIGLAVADELVRLYGGRLQIGRGPLGGAELRIRLPP